MNLDEIFEQIKEDALEDYREDVLEEIREAFLSKEAQESARKVNRFFRKHQMAEVDNPADVANQIESTDEGLRIKLTENQRRFIAADKLYGDDSIGLKYTE
jgi:hypothetical protein